MLRSESRRLPWPVLPSCAEAQHSHIMSSRTCASSCLLLVRKVSKLL